MVRHYVIDKCVREFVILLNGGFYPVPGWLTCSWNLCKPNLPFPHRPMLTRERIPLQLPLLSWNISVEESVLRGLNLTSWFDGRGDNRAVLPPTHDSTIKYEYILARRDDMVDIAR
jgi:hypothetical protein